jgi:FixJ family two-component response regulator
VRRVLLLEDDDDLRGALCELLELIGAAAVVPARSFKDLLAQDVHALSCNLAILDVNLGPGSASGVDAYKWLVSQGFHGDIVFLTGHAHSHPLVREARTLPYVRVYEKPIDGRTLEALVGSH